MIGVSTPFWVTARTLRVARSSPRVDRARPVSTVGRSVAPALAARRRQLFISRLRHRRRARSWAACSARSETQTIDTIDVAVVQGGGPQNTRADVCTTRAVFERHMEASADHRPRRRSGPVAGGCGAPRLATPASTPSRCDDDLLRFTEAIRAAHPARRRSRRRRRQRLVRTHRGRPRQRQLFDRPVARRHASPTATTRSGWCRSASSCRCVRSSRTSTPRSRAATFAPAPSPAILETDVGTLGISISWEVFFDHRARDAIGNGGPGAAQPDQRVELLAHDRTEPADRIEPPAGGRDRAVSSCRRRLPASPASSAPQGEVRRPHRRERAEGALRHRSSCAPAAPWPSQLGAWPMLDLRPRSPWRPCGFVAGPQASTTQTSTTQTSRSQTSMERVIGPSLTSSTAISARKRPVATRRAPAARSAFDRPDSTNGSA